MDNGPTGGVGRRAGGPAVDRPGSDGAGDGDGGYLLKRRNAVERGETTAHGLFATLAVEVGTEAAERDREEADARH